MLSYSTLNLLHNYPHNFLNKMMCIKQEDKIFFQEGREAHSIIQAHLSGEKIDDRLKHINYTFPVVERVDFDPNCKFQHRLDDKYLLIGFFDGIDRKNKRLLEIKTGYQEWSITKFVNSIQRKIYSMVLPIDESILITARRKPEEWVLNKPKVYKVPSTKKDTLEALEWILEGIKILEKGDFTKDLVDGKCTDPYCYWGNACSFK